MVLAARIAKQMTPEYLIEQYGNSLDLSDITKVVENNYGRLSELARPLVSSLEVADQNSYASFEQYTQSVYDAADALKEYDADTPIAITYSAKVNADAEVYPSATANSNEAELEYSTNITDETIKETTPPSNVNVYVFTLDITKVNADNEVLPGAKFVLKDSADNFIPVALDGGRYVVSDTLEANEENATVISDSNGKIYIDGVSEGTYTLTEIEAPENYNLLKEPVELTVTATYNEDGECTGVSGNSATVVNKAGGILPSTGGIGTLIFTASGAAVMLMAAVILVSKKRKSEAK